MKCVMTVPSTEYPSATQTIAPTIWWVVPLKVNEKLPDSAHSSPMKLMSVTTAFSRPMERDIVALVKICMSSWMRWSGLSGVCPSLPA